MGGVGVDVGDRGGRLLVLLLQLLGMGWQK